MDKISVIVPVYKVEKYLNECVESIINQTYKDLEIVLVDDGSPDNCPKMCDEWAKKDKRIKVIHKKNGGLMSAWVEGVKGSSGTYIVFVDSDDYIFETYVEKLYNAIKTNNADISVCNYIKKYDDREENITQIKDNKLLIKGENIDNCIFSYTGDLGLTIAPCRWNKMFKRETVLNSLKYLNTEISMGEDVNMTFYAMTKAERVALINDHLHFYRQVSSSISNTKRNNWPHYKKLIKQLLIINKEEKLNLNNYIYKWFVSMYINECIKFAVANYKRKELKEFLCDEYLQECANNMPIDNFKKRVYYWGIKHKNLFLVKLAAKLIR